MKRIFRRILRFSIRQCKSKTGGEPFDLSQDKLCRTIKNLKSVGLVVLVIIITFVTCGAVAAAQQTGKVARIGYLSPIDPARESSRSEAIRLSLRELGYIKGQDIAIE